MSDEQLNLFGRDPNVDPEQTDEMMATFAEKVEEHADMLADGWLGDWAKLLDRLCVRTGESKEVMLAFLQIIQQKRAVQLLSMLLVTVAEQDEDEGADEDELE